MNNEVRQVFEYACKLLEENGCGMHIGLLKGRFRNVNSLQDADVVCYTVFGACDLSWPGVTSMNHDSNQ